MHREATEALAEYLADTPIYLEPGPGRVEMVANYRCGFMCTDGEEVVLQPGDRFWAGNASHAAALEADGCARMAA